MLLELELLVELATVRVFWVALEAQRGAEVADARLDAGPVPVVAGGGVVDEAHLLHEARDVVVGGDVGAVGPEPEPALPLHGAAVRQGRAVGIREAHQPRHQHDQVEDDAAGSSGTTSTSITFLLRHAVDRRREVLPEARGQQEQEEWQEPEEPHMWRRSTGDVALVIGLSVICVSGSRTPNVAYIDLLMMLLRRHYLSFSAH